jgi:hypothetical protein
MTGFTSNIVRPLGFANKAAAGGPRRGPVNDHGSAVSGIASVRMKFPRL